MLVDFGIDRSKYQWLFQNGDKIFKWFSIEIKNLITNAMQRNEIKDYTERYIEICSLFDS